MVEVHTTEEESGGNETKQVYNFIVMTTSGLISVQCDACQSNSNNNGEAPAPIEIKATYNKQ